MLIIDYSEKSKAYLTLKLCHLSKSEIFLYFFNTTNKNVFLSSLTVTYEADCRI